MFLPQPFSLCCLYVKVMEMRILTLLVMLSLLCSVSLSNAKDSDLYLNKQFQLEGRVWGFINQATLSEYLNAKLVDVNCDKTHDMVRDGCVSQTMRNFNDSEVFTVLSELTLLNLKGKRVDREGSSRITVVKIKPVNESREYWIPWGGFSYVVYPPDKYPRMTGVWHEATYEPCADSSLSC